MITFVVLLLAFSTMAFTYYLFMTNTYGKIHDDETLLMMLQVESKNYFDLLGDREHWKYGGDSLRLRPWKNEDITKTGLPFFPYAIKNMGPVPYWYDTVSAIQALPGNY
jgi:hypothetical protein